MGELLSKMDKAYFERVSVQMNDSDAAMALSFVERRC